MCGALVGLCGVWLSPLTRMLRAASFASAVCVVQLQCVALLVGRVLLRHVSACCGQVGGPVWVHYGVLREPRCELRICG